MIQTESMLLPSFPGRYQNVGQPWRRLFHLDQHDRIVEQACLSDEHETMSSRFVHGVGVGIVAREGAALSVPLRGPVIVVMNRPFGGVAEALALGVWLRRLRQNVIVATSSMLRHVPGLDSECLFFEPTTHMRNNESLARAREVLRADGCVVTAPAALSEAGWIHGNSDDRWHSVAVALAQATGASFLPVRVEGKGRWAGGHLARFGQSFAEYAVARELADLSNTNLRLCFGRETTLETLGADGGPGGIASRLRTLTLDAAADAVRSGLSVRPFRQT